jgi:hypothetical protein
MTLKENLKQNLTGHLSNDKTEVDVNIAATIADNYAIEFLDFAKSETDYDLWETKFDYKGVLYTSKELLEIFKKEKGL